MAEVRVNTHGPLRVYYRKKLRQAEFHFPEELFIEILKCLPVESLIRCMCVSKSWYSLITNPSFVSTHLSYQSDPRSLETASAIYNFASRFFVHRLHEPLGEWTEVDTPADNMGILVVSCCHGVVCLFDYTSDDIGPLILWNPSIKKAFTFPFKEPSFHKSGLRMVGSPSPNFTFGFGFDPVSNDYKVVRVVYNWIGVSNSTYIHTDVCSLNKGGWRSGVRVVEDHEFILGCRSVYLNGVIHWMCMKKQEGAVVFKTVLTFDLANEEFGEICLPTNVNPSSLSRLMSVKLVEDKLAVSCVNFGGNIWVMEEYGKSESWKRLLCFHLGDNVGLIRGAMIAKDGKTVVATSAGNWISWDCTNNKIENFALPVLEPDYMNAYVPSLVLFQCKNGALKKLLNKRKKKKFTARDFRQECLGFSDALYSRIHNIRPGTIKWNHHFAYLGYFSKQSDVAKQSLVYWKGGSLLKAPETRTE